NLAGLAVPVVRDIGGQPIARWELYLRWPDGRRERRPLSGSLDLPDGSKLWIHPVPGEPASTFTSAWGATARRAWLTGMEAPDPADLFRALCERIAFFIDLPADVAAGTTATLALWVTLTYCYQAWGALPYLSIGGPLSSGKSRILEILAR